MELNSLELDVYRAIGETENVLISLLPEIKILSREFSGCGSFTLLSCQKDNPLLGNRVLGLDDYGITIPGIENGLGAVLFCENGKPSLLEIYTYGEVGWGGNIEGYKLEIAK